MESINELQHRLEQLQRNIDNHLARRDKLLQTIREIDKEVEELSGRPIEEVVADRSQRVSTAGDASDPFTVIRGVLEETESEKKSGKPPTMNDRILHVLRGNQGITAGEILGKMMDDGYEPRTEKPANSMYQALNKLKKRRKIVNRGGKYYLSTN